MHGQMQVSSTRLPETDVEVPYPIGIVDMALDFLLLFSALALGLHPLKI